MLTLKNLSPNQYFPGLPQSARAMLFSGFSGPKIFLTTDDRLHLYRDLACFSQSVYVNPALEAYGNTETVLMSYRDALEAFPSNPEDWRLVLELGQKYNRNDLLERLIRMGYAREEDFNVRGDTIELEDIRLEFFGEELDGLKIFGEAKKRHILTAKEGKEEIWNSTKILHFSGTIFLESPSLVPAELWKFLAGRELVTFGLGGPELPVFDIGYRALPPYRARISQMVEDVKNWTAQNYAVVFFYRHAKSRSYVLGKLEGIKSTSTREMKPQPGQVNFVPAPFEGAFTDHANKVIYLTEPHLYAFGGTEAIRNKRIAGGEATDPGGLTVGDYLVHPEHGIGQYMGLETREVLGAKRDYLSLRYGGEGKMYLPVEQLPLLRRHPGTTDDPPALSNLGKGEWKRTKEKAEKDAEELAQRLLVIHAKRDATPGRPFPPVEEWDDLVDKNFPFELTVDQQKAMDDVMGDLEASKPMERLVSGDVGFGKTEVAIRAAHRVVGNGAQVAILVPTTLLAEQHTHTFQKRFEGLPVRVAGISRFTSDRAVTEILKSLKEGKVDILVGTHRLLSGDISFKDLGLLIVDEEHRFGVTQKERIRELKDAVDTLFLSATPIPRTLYSALVGLRDLSSIQTPPKGRRAIQTVLTPFDPAMIRQAIMDEIERGGKAFYVHDRVATIVARRTYLEALVPEARFGIVHGQMSEGDIEESMLAFEEGAFDVLIATTIIESGLDIPEANTIIVERADKLGLAALYQLRGRVGRREKEAWAYLFHPVRLTEGAERRLAAIGDLSDLGAGHLLAEKDMEIRGIGNLLGSEQHGHIRSVSLEVYTELLSNAVNKLKGEVVKPERHVTIDIQVSARITPEYIPSAAARSQLYGRLAEVDKLSALSRIVREMKDRYGSAPDDVENFIMMTKLRLVAEAKGVLSMTEDMLNLSVVFGRWPIDYDAKALRDFPLRAEVVQYPPGFKLRKEAKYSGQQVRLLEDLLYLVD